MTLEIRELNICCLPQKGEEGILYFNVTDRLSRRNSTAYSAMDVELRLFVCIVMETMIGKIVTLHSSTEFLNNNTSTSIQKGIRQTKIEKSGETMALNQEQLEQLD